VTVKAEEATAELPAAGSTDVTDSRAGSEAATGSKAGTEVVTADVTTDRKARDRRAGFVILPWLNLRQRSRQLKLKQQ
jgi:hypothetical protein